MARKRKILITALVVLVVGASMIGVGGYVGLSYVPGGRDAVSFAEVVTKGEIRYTTPADILQTETAKSFPIPMGVEGLVRLVLKNPQFVPDPDPAFLRVKLDLDASVLANGGVFPGQAVVRTQLKFDPAGQTIALTRAELTEFTFTGRAASVAESLRPVLQSALAAELNNYVIYTMPKDAGWWARTGFSLVRDVRVEDRSVVVLVGR